ncbi:MAG: filamentous hemagglutinin N-terminal domain-containing protein [Crocosphaera sp.]
MILNSFKQFCFCLSLLSWGLNHSLAYGQIIPDNTLGAEGSIVNQIDATLSEIEGGAIRGGNLFHSFLDFNIADGGAAYFANPDGIVNIISRVTGNNISNILGTLGVLGEANLFFINPNGIFFGPNAQIDITGSFLASTANSVILPGGVEYSATNPQAPPLLTVNAQAPIGLRFEGIAGTITNQGELYTFGQTLALVGGDVSIQGAGGLIAEQGRIEVGSVTGSGIVGIRQEPSISGFTLNYEEINDFGNITLSEEAFLDTSGEIGGAIQIQGGEVALRDLGFIGSITWGLAPAETITINASDSITLSGDAGIQTISDGGGKAGDILINTGNLILEDGAFIESLSFASGGGGDIQINALGRVELSGIVETEDGPFPSRISNQANADGKAGDINLEAQQLTISDGAIIDAGTFASGKAGDVSIKASESIQLRGGELLTGIFAQTAQVELATGDAGNMVIETQQLDILDGAQISVASRNGSQGGDLTVRVSESILISGTAPNATLVSGQSGLFVSAEPASMGLDGGQVSSGGSSGNLSITTGQLTVEKGAKISADTFGLGTAGELTINVNRLRVSEGGFIRAGSLVEKDSPTFERGNGGTLMINASELVEIVGTGKVAETSVASTLFTAAQGTGNAGNLQISTPQLIIRDGGIVTASTSGEGDTGFININSPQKIELNNNSIISSSVEAGARGNSREITLNTPNLTLTGNSQITASTAGNGNAGSITVLDANRIKLDNSTISTEVESTGVANQPSNITLNTQQLELNNNAKITGSTAGEGDTGFININSPEKIELNNNSIISNSVEQGARGNSREITLNTSNLTLSGNSQVSASTAGNGNAGSITVPNANIIKLDNSTISTEVESTGVANQPSNITLNTQQLDLNNNSEITGSTAGEGDTGFININSPQKIELNNNSIISSSVEQGARGNSREITLNTSNLTLSGNSQVSASTAGNGSAGSITVPNANIIKLDNSTISTEIETTGVANQPSNISLNTQELDLNNNAEITASTANIGDAGNLDINAKKTLSLNNNSTLASSANEGATGDGGNVNLKTEKLTLNNSSRITASSEGKPQADAGSINIQTQDINLDNNSQIAATTSAGEGGSISIQTLTFKADNGSQIRTTTSGNQDAGDINIFARDTIILSGDNTGFFANTTPNSTGDGGNILVDPVSFIIEDGAVIAVDSLGTGDGGNITLFADNLTIKRGSVSAQTTSGTGGNITIVVQDILELRNNAQISTTAGNQNTGGDGGNILIFADFIFAIPSEDSDITANAFTGDGGNITITARGIFGIEPRERLTPFSDITASSELGTDGVIQINALSIDPIEALDTLEQTLVETQIVQGCQAVRRGAVGFFDAGRGGIPITPDDLLRNDTIITPWVPLMEELDQDTLLFFLEEFPDSRILLRGIERLCSQ